MSKIGELVSHAWGVEQSVIDSTPKLTYVVGNDLIIENHGGVEGITPESVVFECGIRVSGEGLAIEWIERDMAVVKGRIGEIKLDGLG